MAEPHLLTTTEAAFRTGHSQRTVQRAAHRGALPVWQRLPGRTGALLFRLEDVDQWAAVADWHDGDDDNGGGAA